ncbi:hypothetical protein L218DRAFT_1079171 [Marasmius fiardii PR-910]|nr:hypothetical protein L218DRAFT_1079171 [Marasmius fiardii PR-910]
MSTISHEPIPGPSSSVLGSSNSRKRHSSEDPGDASLRTAKRWKTESPSKTMKDKKKRKKKKRKTTIVGDSENRSRSRPESRDSRASCSVSIKPTSACETVSTVGQTDGSTGTALRLNREREIAPVEVSHTRELVDPSVSLNQLNAELRTKSLLVHQHEQALSQVQQSITCQICLDLLYKPYALAPCGHTACHSCLVSWFTSQPVHDGALPDGHRPHNFYTRKKTCPHCRAIIRERPVEVWAIENMVIQLAQSGLLTNVPQPIPDDTLRSSENKDPWHNIFRPPPKCPETLYGEERPVTDLPVEETGMYDAEDGGIYRCLDCMHEIEDGICSGCDRAYNGHAQLEAQRADTGAFWDDWDGARYMEDLVGGFWGNPDDLEIYDSESDSVDVGHARLVRRIRNRLAGEGTGVDIDIEELSGSEDESYEGSFIDDDSDGAIVLTDTERNPEESGRHRRRIFPVPDGFELSDDDDGSESENDDGDHDSASRHVSCGWMYHSNSDTEGEGGEGEGEEEGDELSADDLEDESYPRLHTRSRSYRLHAFSDPESDEEDDGSIPGPPARLRHLVIDEYESD